MISTRALSLILGNVRKTSVFQKQVWLAIAAQPTEGVKAESCLSKPGIAFKGQVCHQTCSHRQGIALGNQIHPRTSSWFHRHGSSPSLSLILAIKKIKRLNLI